MRDHIIGDRSCRAACTVDCVEFIFKIVRGGSGAGGRYGNFRISILAFGYGQLFYCGLACRRFYVFCNRIAIDLFFEHVVLTCRLIF